MTDKDIISDCQSIVTSIATDCLLRLFTNGTTFHKSIVAALNAIQRAREDLSLYHLIVHKLRYRRMPKSAGGTFSPALNVLVHPCTLPQMNRSGSVRHTQTLKSFPSDFRDYQVSALSERTHASSPQADS